MLSLLSSTRLCAECGETVLVDESIVLGGLPVCANCKPAALAKLQGGLALGDAGIWCEKKTLVLGARAILPDRCIKCNEPANGNRLKRNLYWHPQGWYALILLNLVIYAVVAAIVRKRANIEVGLCAKHHRARWTAIAAGWALILAGLAGMIGGAIQPGQGWLALVGFTALVFGIFWGIIGGRVVFAREITPSRVRVGGAGRAFLQTLPALQEAT
jgi:hypothetical protein